jgi:nucleoside-diphosphate-sugar epimerase
MDALFTGAPMKLVNGGVSRRCYTYIDDAIECTYRIVENPGSVCDRQIFNIGSPYNEVSIQQMAHLMREIYAQQFRDAATPLPEIISVPGEEFYGEGYDDSDRRIPDIEKARTLLGWEPRLNTRETFETTMRHHVIEYRNSRAWSKTSSY